MNTREFLSQKTIQIKKNTSLELINQSILFKTFKHSDVIGE